MDNEIGILNYPTSQLNLDVVLANGQSFRWKKDLEDSKCWMGIAYHCLWKIWRIDDNKIAFKLLHNFQKEKIGLEFKSSEDILENYFQYS